MNLHLFSIDGLELTLEHQMLYVLLAVLISLISTLRAKRGLFSFLLRSLTLLTLLFIIWPPKIKQSIEEIQTDKTLALIDSSLSMGEDAVKKCEEDFRSQNNEIFYFSDSLREDRGSSSNRSSTNLEQSLKELSKKVHNRKILLCSDGLETKGKVSNVIPNLRDNNLEIIPVYPDARLLLSTGLKLTAFEAPLKITQGQNISLGFTLENQTDALVKDEIEILVDSKPNSSINDKVNSFSSKSFKKSLSPLSPGKHKISIVSKSSSQALSRWVFVEENLRPLILHADEQESLLLRKIYPILGTSPEHLLVSNMNSLPTSLEQYNTVILNDIPANKLSSEFLTKLKSHILSGKRLVILGGDSSFGLGKYQESILNEISPLQAVPPRSKVERLPSAVILVVDKSGSMAEQGKIMAARMAALSSIESLKDEDYVSVIGFDSGPLAVIELGLVKDVKAEARERLQSNLQARGHTNLLPALSLARLRLSNIKAGRKHIIVLSDGQIPQSGSDAFVAELNRIKSERITISTVALGYEADVPFMKMVAQQGRGSFYQTLDPSRLPKLFVDDIKVSVGEDTISEQAIYPILKGPADLISTSTSIPPDIGGFIETKLKNEANLELITQKGQENFPILASMGLGSGRVIAFASDLQGRWSKSWLRWNELVRFVGDLTAGDSGGKGDGLGKDTQFDFRYSINGGVLKLELYVFDKSALQSAKSITLNLNRENGKQSEPLQFTQKEEGLYTTSIEIKESDDYFLNGNIGSLQIKDIGINISPKDLGEYQGGGINYDLLEELRRETSKNEIKNTLKKESSKGAQSTERYLDTRNLIYLCILLLVVEVLVRERR